MFNSDLLGGRYIWYVIVMDSWPTLRCAQSAASVYGLVILDGDGNRVCAKYYQKKFPLLADQKKFEAELFRKTRHSNAKVEGRIVLTCVLYMKEPNE
jgi:hypothetical protein